MEISLVRHGRSQCVNKSRLTCEDFLKWIEEYDRSGVLEELSFPPVTVEKVTTAGIVVTSDLLRSIDSTRLLGADGISDSMFRETELPRVNIRGLRLSSSIWAVWFRLLWFCGYSKKCESIGVAKERAKGASRKLTEMAKEHGSVVLVGHGFFNMLISKELKRNGWVGRSKASSKHWSCTTYSR